jgi:thioredoxin 1
MNRIFLNRIYTALVLIGLWLSTFTTSRAQTEIKLSPDEFEKALTAQTGYQLVDVRTKEEFAKDHLKNSLNINVKGNDFDKLLTYLDKSKPTYVYCLSGGRSAVAAEKMRTQGFTKVYELDGGILKWNSTNKPVEKSDQIKKQPGLSTEAFGKLLESDKLVLVDFGAKWCSPCKKMAPILEKFASDFNQQVKLVKIDVDENQELTKSQQVTELPTLFLYKGKKIVWQQTGFMDEAGLKQVFEKHSGK